MVQLRRFRVDGAFALHVVGDRESHLHRLIVVQPRINGTFISPFQIRFAQIRHAADTFGDVVAGQLKMNAAKDRAFGSVDFEL